jgi:hypothetical protein
MILKFKSPEFCSKFSNNAKAKVRNYDSEMGQNYHSPSSSFVNFHSLNIINFYLLPEKYQKILLNSARVFKISLNTH